MSLIAGTPELLFSGAAWTEGPVWLPTSARVRFSDIPNDRILEFDPATGETRVHRTDVEFTNGRTLDRDGHVIQCSHGRRAIEREVDGVPTTLVDRWAGGRFNSPNDVIVAADGAIWFTDPPYGLHPSGREGHPGEQDYAGCFVFRYDGAEARPVITDMTHPNGLALSPDESMLYVAETATFWHPEVPWSIRVYDTTTFSGREFAAPSGLADGFRVDAAGRLWTSSGASLAIYAPTGHLLETVDFPERVSNLCFGGADGRDLYLTVSTGLYRLRLGESPTAASRGPRAGGISRPSSMS